MDKSMRKKRMYALLIDGIMLVVVLFIWLILIYLLQELLGLYQVKTGPKYVVKMVLNFSLLIILFGLTFIYLPSLAETTFGKYMMGLKIEPISGRITFGRILFRSLFKLIFYSTIIGIFIDYFTVFILKQDATHDRLLRTTVIER
ncbi:RDD family protein [Haloplasma contractile]|uniref:RDD domain containing protein n=1 Tax=Haloplasma contractile SSD-17B TaxID=1033810 RepID=U2EBG5_9MOLU|nr:RDD family protein [Haloplasma contractile]ERJ12423.1 RDD domain containing protein [Haloplasma contractile SSD-17B]